MRSSRALAAAAVLTVTVVVATAAAGGETTTGSRPTSGRPSVRLGEKAAREALALWRRFPAGADVRPIVIPFGPGIVNAPRDQHEDLAIYHATWMLKPPREMDLTNGRRHHWISAADAKTALRSGLKHAPKPTATLTVRVQLGRSLFVTDRGKRDLPAWQYSFGRFRERASVLAVVPFNAPPPRRLDPAGVGNSEDGEQAITSSGGRTLEISFVGGHAGNRPCDDSYSATASQSDHAVAFTIYEHPAPAPPNTACTAVGYQRTAVVHLDRPLGARVLVDSTDGGAIPVARKPTFPRGARSARYRPQAGAWQGHSASISSSRSGRQRAADGQIRGQHSRLPPESNWCRGVVGQGCCKENGRTVQTAGCKVALTNNQETVMAMVIRCQCGLLGRGETVEEAATAIEAHALRSSRAGR